MDYQTFIEQLPSLYHQWGQASVQPKSDRFQTVLQQIEGMTTVNVLQLLNFAVACLEPGEVYCEVGCFKGSTLTGALLNHPDRMAYAIDNFSEFDPTQENQSKLLQNLAAFGLDEQVFFCDQDFEAFFADLRFLETSDRIGVYLYDGAHDYRSQLMGLLLVKPFLADRALIIVDDSNWDAVQQANWDFIAAHPQCQLLLDLPTPAQSYDEMSSCSFWNGLQILSWDVQAKHTPAWETLQQVRKPGLIHALYTMTPVATAPVNAWDTLEQEAANLRTAAQLPEAEQAFVALQQNDQQADWHGLGMVYDQMERQDDAFKALSQAIALNPAIAAYHYSLGMVLEKMGDIAAAGTAYQQALALDDTLIDAYNNLGNLVLTHGDAHQAELLYRKAIAQHPNHLGTYVNLGNALVVQNKIDDAIATYQIALQLDPDDAAAIENLAFAQTLQHDPAQMALYLGDRFYHQQHYEAALAQYQTIATTQAIAFYQSLADCYKNVDQPEAAIETYHQGLNHYPNEPSLHLSLILALQNAGRLQEAIQVAAAAIQRFPHNLAFTIEHQRLLPLIYQTAEEISMHRQRFIHALNQLVQVPLVTPEQYQTALKGIGQSTNFLLSYQGQNDLDLQKQYGAFVQKVMAANFPQWSQPLSLPSLKPGEKIRVGYVSGCLWSHTVGKLMIGWLRHHDRTAFEIYSYNVRDCYDHLTQEYRNHSDIFYQIPNDLEKICRQITANKLHVLVFFDLGMQGLMTQLAGLRLAPVQCSTWGHPVTSGLPTVDYFLSSALMEPENAQEHYAETLVCLPKIGISYAQPVISEPTKTRRDFGLREDAVVYLACQLLCKLLPQYDYIFATIARQVPQAQFVFIARPSSAYVLDLFNQRLHQAFASVGLDSDRHCVMLSPQAQADYWDLNQRSDVFLDSFSWSGGHTTLEAIACKLPVVTCPGEFMRGRHSSAILQALGMTETIAQTEADYIAIAVRLGHDATWRQRVLAQMRDRFSHLYDDTTCITALETFYQQVVRGEE